MNLIRTSSFAKSTLLSSNENLLNSVSLPDEQIRRLIFSIFGVKTAHVREIWDAYASSVCSDGSKKKKNNKNGKSKRRTKREWQSLPPQCVQFFVRSIWQHWLVSNKLARSRGYPNSESLVLVTSLQWNHRCVA